MPGFAFFVATEADGDGFLLLKMLLEEPFGDGPGEIKGLVFLVLRDAVALAASLAPSAARCSSNNNLAASRSPIEVLGRWSTPSPWPAGWRAAARVRRACSLLRSPVCHSKTSEFIDAMSVLVVSMDAPDPLKAFLVWYTGDVARCGSVELRRTAFSATVV